MGDDNNGDEINEENFAYDVLRNQNDNCDEVDVVTVTSDISDIDVKDKLKKVDSDFIEEKLDTIVTKEILLEYDILLMVVTDDEGSKEIDITIQALVDTKITNLVTTWKEEASTEERQDAITRISYIAQLTQMNQEIDRKGTIILG